MVIAIRSTHPGRRAPDDPIDLREQLFNDGLVRPGRHDPAADRADHPPARHPARPRPGQAHRRQPVVPPADDPRQFHDNIRPVLQRHPLARHAEVRLQRHRPARDPPAGPARRAHVGRRAEAVGHPGPRGPVHPARRPQRAGHHRPDQGGRLDQLQERRRRRGARARRADRPRERRSSSSRGWPRPPSGPWRRSCWAPSTSSPARSAGATGPTSTSSTARAGATAAAAMSRWRRLFDTIFKPVEPAREAEGPGIASQRDRASQGDESSGPSGRRSARCGAAYGPGTGASQERQLDHGFPGVPRPDAGVDALRQPARLPDRPGRRRPRAPDRLGRHPRRVVRRRHDPRRLPRPGGPDPPGQRPHLQLRQHDRLRDRRAGRPAADDPGRAAPGRAQRRPRPGEPLRGRLRDQAGGRPEPGRAEAHRRRPGRRVPVATPPGDQVPRPAADLRRSTSTSASPAGTRPRASWSTPRRSSPRSRPPPTPRTPGPSTGSPLASGGSSASSPGVPTPTWSTPSRCS